MTVCIRPARSADREAIARIYTLARPGNPATTASLAAEEAAQAEAGALHRRWLAEEAGQVWGAAEILEPLGSRAAGSFWLELAVLPEGRGRGVGGALYEALLTGLPPGTLRRLKAVVSEANPAALGFAGRRGFREVERFWDRTVELQSSKTAENPRPLPPDVELVSLASFLARAAEPLASLHPLYEEIRRDLPRSPGETFTPLPLRATQTFLESLDPALVTLAVRGDRPLGLVALEPSGTPGELMIVTTGVARPERRQGLARALKVASMLGAREAGWRVVRTSNHGANAGILALNDALGFGREPARLGMLKVWPAEDA